MVDGCECMCWRKRIEIKREYFIIMSVDKWLWKLIIMFDMGIICFLMCWVES